MTIALLRRSLAVSALGGCFPSRPEFIEPKWGGAPPPLAFEVTEITQEYRHCAQQCRYHRVILRRDGQASRVFRTANHADSILVTRIDSIAFVQLAESLRRNHFFSALRDGDGGHEPLSAESYVISAATLCRRRVVSISDLQLRGPGGYVAVRSAIDSAVGTLRWARPQHHR